MGRPMTDRPTHMAEAGYSDEYIDETQKRAMAMEEFVAVVYGGTRRPDRDPIGDVNIPGHGIVDVKSVPHPNVKVINGGDHQPRARAIIVSAEPRLILGLVERETWRLGVPTNTGWSKPARLCWHVRRAEVFPPPAPWIKMGCVLPEWYEMPEDEVLHTDWNDRKGRQRERARAMDSTKTLFGEEYGRPVSGLSLRKGHAPGKDNWRRTRP